MVAFDPAFYLYLNPTLRVQHGVTVDTAETYFSEHSHDTLYADPALVPVCFNESVYIEDHKNVIDVSPLNRAIMEDEQDCTVDSNSNSCSHACTGKFVNNIGVRIHLISRNKFKVCHETCHDGIPQRSMQNLDEITIQKGRHDLAHARVTNVSPCRTEFMVSNQYFDFTDRDAAYHVAGIKVSDPCRVALINYMGAQIHNQHHHRNSRTGELCKIERLNHIDSTFNAELYKMLYPDARSLTCMGAYLDYASRKSHGHERIHAAMDFATVLGLCISKPVTFMGMEIRDISRDARRRGSEVLNHSSLITEKAIKEYVDGKSRFDEPLVEFCGKRVEFKTGNVEFKRGLGTLCIGIGTGIRERKHYRGHSGVHSFIKSKDACSFVPVVRKVHDGGSGSESDMSEIDIPNLPRICHRERKRDHQYQHESHEDHKVSHEGHENHYDDHEDHTSENEDENASSYTLPAAGVDLSDLTVIGPSVFLGKTVIGSRSALTMDSALDVSGDVVIGGSLNTTGELSARHLTVKESSSFQGAVSVCGDLAITGNISSAFSSFENVTAMKLLAREMGSCAFGIGGDDSHHSRDSRDSREDPRVRKMHALFPHINPDFKSLTDFLMDVILELCQHQHQQRSETLS